MSLINKMLKDLETRQSGMPRPDPQSIYQGLRASGASSNHRRRNLAIVVTAALVLIVVAGWLGWQRFHQTTAPDTTAPVSTTLAPTGPAVVMPQSKTSTPARHKSPAAVRQPSRPAVSVSAGTAPVPAAIEVTGHPLTAEEQAENKYREGVKSVRQLRLEDAEQQLRAALALDPKHVHARETLAALLVEHGRWLEAQAVLEEGLRLLPNQASFGFLLARLYVQQGKDAAGLQLLERLEPHAGGEPEYLAFMAALYQRTGRHADAIRYFKQVTAARPTEGRWWAGLGISLEAEGDRENARAAYERASTLALDPRLAEYVADRLKQLPSR